MSGFDVVVVGAGITGAGVARDAALRGMRVCLVEQRDLASGTTWGSSGMIHGGVRYLEHDWEITRVSCLDGGYILRTAPHLLFPVVFLIPVFRDSKISIETAEVGLEAYDRFQRLKGGRPHVRLSAAEALQLEPGLSPDLVGALTMEEWGVDPARLATLVALGAREAGAELRTWTEVVGLLRDGARISGVRVRSRLGAGIEQISARIVVNAGGPWAGELAAMGGASLRLRPAKGIHLIYDRRITNVALTVEAVDGRGLLLVPHASTTLVGTTDDDFYGDPEHLDVTDDEVEYVLEAAQRVLPGIRDYRIAHATAAVRPTLYEWRRYEDDLSRDYAVVDHGAGGAGAPGLVSVAGGKMSMFRKMAEDTVDAVERLLGRPHVACTTHTAPLPGGDRPVDTVGLAAAHRLPLPLANRLVGRHGDRAAALLAAAAPHERAAVLCECEPVTVAELRHSIRHEHVERLEDLYRRVRWSAGACLGMRCCWEAARVMGEERGWTPRRVEEEVRDFLTARWHDRPTVMAGPALAQEELARGALYSFGDLAGAGRRGAPPGAHS
ncbi:MAG TPA: glycerol-3-phosphate dehydrogenase/oxidase [Candidatus Dormibacteraeota bacterium]